MLGYRTPRRYRVEAYRVHRPVECASAAAGRVCGKRMHRGNANGPSEGQGFGECDWETELAERGMVDASSADGAGEKGDVDEEGDDEEEDEVIDDGSMRPDGTEPRGDSAGSAADGPTPAGASRRVRIEEIVRGPMPETRQPKPTARTADVFKRTVAAARHPPHATSPWQFSSSSSSSV